MSMSITPQEFEDMRRRVAFNRRKIIEANAPKTNCPLPDTKPERHQAAALVRTSSGEIQSDGRITVRFVGYRVKPLDPDNFAGSVKDLLDGLRHASLISDDDPCSIKLETEQVKVSHFEDERTEIEIFDGERM